MASEKSTPQFAVSDANLVSVNDFPQHMQAIPTSRMFVIKQSLNKYLAHAGVQATIFDASQGDGGESLAGVPREVLLRANEMQLNAGTAYGGPAGNEFFLKAVVEKYWKLDAETAWGTGNVVAVQGGRDGLMKAFDAMIHCGRSRVGDALLTSAVPWISYNWGPYAAYLNVLRAAGDPAEAWAYSEESIEEAVQFADRSGRRIAGMLITSPDNPTGRTMALDQQIRLAHKALDLGVAFVLFDWIYHWVTEGEPYDVNKVLKAFEPEKRDRLIFLDGITKSLGGSNIRNAHLLASTTVVKHITSRSSHGVIPSYYSQAVAVAAYEMGFAQAVASTVTPTNASRNVMHQFVADKGLEAILGDGYYAFINTERWIAANGLLDSAELGSALAEQFGVAVVPGVFFSPAAKNWIRFSYALPPERTAAALERFYEGLPNLKGGRG